jgi:hypothetical protein
MSYGHGTGLGLAGRWGFRPTDIAGCILWLRADRDVTVTGAGVSTWLDQSGQGNDAVQTNAACRPALSPTGGPAGRPAVDFDRANEESMYWAAGTFSDASTNYTILAALTQRNVTTFQQSLFSWVDGGVGQVVAPVARNASQVGGYDNTTWRWVAAAVNGAQLLSWTLDDPADLVTCYRNGASIGSAAWTPSVKIDDDGGSNLVRLGAGWWSSAAIPQDAALSEIIVYNSALGAADLARAHAYLGARYGL